MRNVPQWLPYLNTGSAVDGAIWGHGTFRRYSLARGSTLVGAGFSASCSLCFLCVDKDVVSQLPAPASMASLLFCNHKPK